MKARILTILAALAISATSVQAHRHDHGDHHRLAALLSEDTIQRLSTIGADHATPRVTVRGISKATLGESNAPGKLTLRLRDRLRTEHMVLSMITDITGDYEVERTDRGTLRGKMVNNRATLRRFHCQPIAVDGLPLDSIAEHHPCHHLALLQNDNVADAHHYAIDDIVWGEGINTSFAVTIMSPSLDDDRGDRVSHDEPIHHRLAIRNHYQTKRGFPSGVPVDNQLIAKVGHFERITADNISTQFYKAPGSNTFTLNITDTITINIYPTIPLPTLDDMNATIKLNTHISGWQEHGQWADNSLKVKVKGTCSGNTDACNYVNAALESGKVYMKHFEKDEKAMVFSVVIGGHHDRAGKRSPIMVNHYKLPVTSHAGRYK